MTFAVMEKGKTMSKYIKLEDMENLIINIAPDGDVFTRGISALQSLPTIEVSDGKWVKDEYDISHCSECGCINNTFYRNYCPNCGTKMEG